MSESASILWGEDTMKSLALTFSLRELREKSSFPILVPLRIDRKYVGGLGLKEGSGEETGEDSGELSTRSPEVSSADPDISN